MLDLVRVSLESMILKKTFYFATFASPLLQFSRLTRSAPSTPPGLTVASSMTTGGTWKRDVSVPSDTFFKAVETRAWPPWILDVESWRLIMLKCSRFPFDQGKCSFWLKKHDIICQSCWGPRQQSSRFKYHGFRPVQHHVSRRDD